MFTAFVSDLHLSPERPGITQVFLRFLKEDATRAIALYILGDLFEHWIGDDAIGLEFNSLVVEALHTLSGETPIFVMRGNRDFLLKSRFEKQSGARIIEDPVLIDLHGHPTLLMHGDTLCTDDVRYQAFRKRARNPIVQWLFLALPLSSRLKLVERTRRFSEKEKQIKSSEIMDVTQTAVESAFRTHPCERIIHGHTHRPARHEHTVGGTARERWVLSDWYTHGEYLRCDASGCQAVRLS
ncbi:MAG: UDP-2,3-diacylglucosamine diphosphatase [Betaproteobacteria bacterium]|nr:UDP-2,3-diacylglucosamine diphosphatase [Betaproteobacteria bacterium]